MSKNIRITIGYSLAHALFWMNLCLYISFAAVYLQALGYSNTRLGLIIGLGNILSFALSVLISSLIDRYPKFKAGDAINISLVFSLLMLIVLWISGRRGIVTSVTYVLLIGSASAVSSLLIKQWSDLRTSGYLVSFGTARAIGSAGYMILAAVMGRAVELNSEAVLLKTGIVLSVLQLIINLILNGKTTRTVSSSESAARGTSLPRFLRENSSFTLLLAGMILIFFSHNTNGNFLINVVNNVGGTTTSFGNLNAFIAIVEVPVMLAYNRICRNRNLSRVLCFALVMFSLKAFLYAMAPSVPLLYAAALSQMVSYALFTPAIVDYVSAVIPAKDSAKGQTLAYGTSTLGSVFASMFGGMMYDSLSVRTTLLIAFGVCVAGSLLCALALGAGKRKRAQ